MGYEGEYLKTLWPGKELLPGQKVWLAVLAPLIIVALVVPLVAILFSGTVPFQSIIGKPMRLFFFGRR